MRFSDEIKKVCNSFARIWFGKSPGIRVNTPIATIFKLFVQAKESVYITKIYKPVSRSKKWGIIFFKRNWTCT